MKTKKLVLTALFSAFALVVFIIENALPPLLPFAPGVKLGLSNIFIMFAVLFCGSGSGLIVAIVKSVLGSVFSGNIFALFYSFPASVLSLITFVFFYRLFYKKISLVAMSALSSLVFNTCQIVTAALVLSSLSVFSYLPYVLFIGCVTGLFTGGVVHFTIKAAASSSIK